MEAPSIAIIPSAYKEGVLAAVLPTPVYGEELIVNGDFATDSDWTKDTGWTISGGTANVDGTFPKNLYQSNVTEIGKTYKYSFRILNSSIGIIDGRLRNRSGGSILNFSSEGLYSGTFIADGLDVNFITLSLNTATWSIDNVSIKEVIAGSADLEVTRESSATRVNKNGFIETVGNNIPRLDYSDGGCPSYLLEPQSTNLLTYSEDFSKWSSQGINILNEKTISPGGNLDANILVESSEDEVHRVFLVPTLELNQNYTFSIFVKPVIGARNFYIAVSPLGMVVYFDLQNETFNASQGEATIKKIGNYYKCTVVGLGVDNGSHAFRLGLSDNGAVSYQGDGESSIAFWGAQLEKQNTIGYRGTYATSYIPTTGTIATRLAETASKTGLSNYINSSEGVLYAEIAALADDLTWRFITINDGTSNNQVAIAFQDISKTIRVGVRNGNVQIVSLSYNFTDIDAFYKIAIKYKENDFALWINGVKVGIYLSGSVFSANTLNNFAFDYGGGTLDFFGKTKQLQYFDTALTDEELETLTTL